MVEEFDELGVGLGIEEGEIPAAVVVEIDSVEEDKLPATFVEKFGMKGGGNAEIGAVPNDAPRGFILVIVPFTNQTP